MNEISCPKNAIPLRWVVISSDTARLLCCGTCGAQYGYLYYLSGEPAGLLKSRENHLDEAECHYCSGHSRMSTLETVYIEVK